MSNEEAKRTVLARRARFVAAAMAGLATASCDACNPPQPCLSQAMNVDSGLPPGPCLSVAYIPNDAGEQLAIDDAGDAGNASDAGDAGAAGKDAGKKVVVGPPAPPPMPCLSPTAPPQPCLKPPPPRVCLDVPF